MSARTSPGANLRVSGKPLSVSTSSIRRFSVITSASKVAIPARAARSASSPISSVPRPRLCIRSSTARAISAVPRWCEFGM